MPNSDETILATTPVTSGAVCVLADHLDAALAAGEDLLAAARGWPMADPAHSGALASLRAAQRRTIECIRALELTVVARVLKAREWAEDLARAEPFLQAPARLFTAGTAILLDAVAECGDATEADFETGDGLTAYLRSRGLIAADAPGLPDDVPLAVTEDFLLVRRIPLGPLMDLVAMFLDRLDLLYELYGPESRGTADRSAAAHADAQASAQATAPAET